MRILRNASEDEINETLEGDRLWCRRLLLRLRPVFMVPMMVG
jgi:hypothetical protein